MALLRVAMVAPPWLAVPPKGYGGIENVVGALVPELRRLGAKVELFTIGASELPVDKKHWLYQLEQYGDIHKPIFETVPIAVAHLLYALNAIREDGDFDIIHDHNGFLGALLFGYGPTDLPPMVQTFHGPPFSTPDRQQFGIPDNMPMWRQFKTAHNMWIVPISRAITKGAPLSLRSRILDPVYNMVDVSKFPLETKKDDYFITLARFHPEKGQHLAVKACKALGKNLKMAGTVAGMSDPKKVMKELDNPLSPVRGVIDFRYFSSQIVPHLSSTIQYVGNVKEAAKLTFISKAKALLFPIQWDEPFGMVLIEALACGTPVIAMRRGAAPEIVQHGVNGFLADNLTEFKYFMKRIGDIDPQVCRQSLAQHFSARATAKKYIERYEQAMALAGAKLTFAAR